MNTRPDELAAGRSRWTTGRGCSRTRAVFSRTGLERIDGLLASGFVPGNTENCLFLVQTCHSNSLLWGPLSSEVGTYKAVKDKGRLFKDRSPLKPENPDATDSQYK